MVQLSSVVGGIIARVYTSIVRLRTKQWSSWICWTGYATATLTLCSCSLRASTWSRVRHHGTEGPPPVRTRALPLGLSALHAKASARVAKANQDIEIASWFAQQSVTCSHHRVAFLWVFPEDFGGHPVSGPTSIWSLADTRSLTAFPERQFSKTDLCRPLAVLTNMTSLDDKS